MGAKFKIITQFSYNVYNRCSVCGGRLTIYKYIGHVVHDVYYSGPRVTFVCIRAMQGIICTAGL